jgi:glycerophosphoryl diester phosphodiesterase
LALLGRSPRSVAVVAHRGGAALAPENTFSAFDNAIGLGVDAIEFDVRLTSDGALVVLHDDKLNRTTNGRGQVLATPSSVVAHLDAGSGFHVPFAEDAMRAVVDAGVVPVIDVKDSGPVGVQAARVLCEAIAAADIDGIPLVVARSRPVLDVVASMCPRTPIAPVVLSYGGLMGCLNTNVDGCFSFWRSLTEAACRIAREHGVFVAAWTVPPKALRGLVSSGNVDAIVTDDPASAMAARQD